MPGRVGGPEIVRELGTKVQIAEHERLLTPGEVAARFRVTPKTVTRWANAGKLTSVRTLGGHRRFKEAEVILLIEV